MGITCASCSTCCDSVRCFRFRHGPYAQHPQVAAQNSKPTIRPVATSRPPVSRQPCLFFRPSDTIFTRPTGIKANGTVGL